MSSDSVSPSVSSRRPLIVRGLTLAVALGAVALRQQPARLLRVIFPAVDGDAVIIQFPDGSFALIDGGASQVELAVELGRWLPFWKRELALVLLTAPDSRHLPGQVGALQRYQVRRALATTAVIGGRGALQRAWSQLLTQQHVLIQPIDRGLRIALGGTRLQILSANQGGALLRLEYGTTSAVFAHASDPGSEQPLVDSHQLQHADLLAFPWQRDPRTPLVEALRPRWIHFTGGYQVKTPARLTYTERAVGGARLSHGRVDGVVVWASDGRSAWLETPDKRSV